MTGLLHFAAKIKFVPVLKSQPSHNARERQMEEREREKKIIESSKKNNAKFWLLDTGMREKKKAAN